MINNNDGTFSFLINNTNLAITAAQSKEGYVNGRRIIVSNFINGKNQKFFRLGKIARAPVSRRRPAAESAGAPAPPDPSTETGRSPAACSRASCSPWEWIPSRDSYTQSCPDPGSRAHGNARSPAHPPAPWAAGVCRYKYGRG